MDYYSLGQLTTIDAIRQFLDGTQAVVFFLGNNKRERYRWMQKTLVQHAYWRLGKADKGTVIRHLMKVTGYAHAQIKRLIRQYAQTGAVLLKPARHNGFQRRYTATDSRSLAVVDESGLLPARKELAVGLVDAGPPLQETGSNAWTNGYRVMIGAVLRDEIVIKAFNATPAAGRNSHSLPCRKPLWLS